MMRLETLDNQLAYEPGGTIDGLATWDLRKAPRAVEVRLIWYTSGKGTVNAAVVDRWVIENPAASDVQSFSFKLPLAPYSYSGHLLSLIWAIELANREKKREAVRLDFTMAPGMTEVRHQAV